MSDKAKRAAQEALFDAIKEQAETNMRAAIRPTEKAQLLRELAEAYRLTAGGTVRKAASGSGSSAGGGESTDQSGQEEGAKPSRESGRRSGQSARPARKARSSAGSSRG